VEVGAPAEGQLKIRNKAIGLNFVDVYQRTGLYKTALPFVAGNEGAGEVIAVGPGVTGFKVGDRIAYQGPVGAYAEERLLPVDKAAHLPDGISYEVAAASLLKGATAFYLLHWTHELKAGETILVHAAAGGTGQILTQWAKAIGATVIGTAGSDEKCEIVRKNGADLAINYKTEDVAARVKEFAPEGINVWWETLREPDFDRTISLLAPRGRMILMAGRDARPQFPVGPFYVKGCHLYGFAMFNATTDELRAAAEDVNRWLAAGQVKPCIDRVLPLSETAEAHRLQEDSTVGKSGTLAGKIVLRP
jgi:NADPH2:quinone reductase